eukprot:2021535-Rhodomonas_salina.1
MRPRTPRTSKPLAPHLAQQPPSPSRWSWTRHLRFFHTSWEVSSLCAEASELIDLAVIRIAHHHLAGDLAAALRDDYVM